MGSAAVNDGSNSDSAEAVVRAIVETDDKFSLISSETLLGAALLTILLELRAASGRLVIVISAYPVSTGELMVVKASS